MASRSEHALSHLTHALQRAPELPHARHAVKGMLVLSRSIACGGMGIGHIVSLALAEIITVGDVVQDPGFMIVTVATIGASEVLQFAPLAISNTNSPSSLDQLAVGFSFVGDTFSTTVSAVVVADAIA